MQFFNHMAWRLSFLAILGLTILALIWVLMTPVLGMPHRVPTVSWQTYAHYCCTSAGPCREHHLERRIVAPQVVEYKWSGHD